MNRARARRRVPCVRGHVVVLRTRFRDHLDSRADAIAIALGALQLEFDPMTIPWTLVDPDLRGRIDRTYHHVEASVSIQVSNGRATMPRRRLGG